jgi:hypothetical protein
MDFFNGFLVYFTKRVEKNTILKIEKGSKNQSSMKKKKMVDIFFQDGCLKVFFIVSP